MTRSRRAALLVVNPSAGRGSQAPARAVTARLREHFRLEVVTTAARDEGVVLARRAADAGTPLVIAYGGDGHVNEVVNGLAGTASALGVIPGGTMNVFARALGIPLDGVHAVEHLVAAVERAPRWVPLGRMDDRLFTFSAGCGFDAETAALVERYAPAKRRVGGMFFYWSALQVLGRSYARRNATMELRGAFGVVEVAMAVVTNAGPYAYILGRPIALTPDVTLEGGLDVFALRKMRIELLPLYAWGAVVWGDMSRHPDSFSAHDLQTVEVSSSEPFARHVDGEPLTPSATATFSVAADALRVYA